MTFFRRRIVLLLTPTLIRFWPALAAANQMFFSVADSKTYTAVSVTGDPSAGTLVL